MPLRFNIPGKGNEGNANSACFADGPCKLPQLGGRADGRIDARAWENIRQHQWPHERRKSRR